MAHNYKKIISLKLIFSFIFALAILVLLFFTLPLSTVHPYEVSAYSTGGSDSATGLGTQINPEGNWFMYNPYSGGSGSYPIQAGNPKNGENTIGTYQVTKNPDGTYTVAYNINEGINVTAEHLAISNSPNFTGKPGQDDNQDYGVPFTDSDGSFYIFAHFGVEY